MATRWAVRLAVEQAMSNEFVMALIDVVDAHQIREIRVAGPEAEYDDGSDTVTFELDASTVHEARIRTQHWLGEAARRNGLPVELARVIWIAPVLQSPASSRRFMEMARTLLENEDTADLAVVAAQIHLELHVKALITNAVAGDPSPLRTVLVDDRGHTWGPHHQMAQALLRALFGLDPANDYDRWQDYRDHLKRRNDVAHRGQTVSVADAEASISVVEDLWVWLAEGASQRPAG